MKIMSLIGAVSLVAAAMPVVAQNSYPGKNPHTVIVVPDSSVQHAADVGKRAHTNHLILMRTDASPNASSGPTGNTPATIYPVYGVTPGGGGTIAIVDAYDYPTASNDLHVFSLATGLPDCTTENGCLKIVWPGSTKPRGNCGWNQEAALDIQWAHAMAPNAKIVLVEAKTNSNADLYAAVDYATTQVLAGPGGKGEVSMSWGGAEYSTEASSDFHFAHSGVVYFASSGDTGGATIYPSASPNVVAAGGTSLNRNADKSFKSETGWSGSGGGASKYEPIPSFQSGVAGVSATKRSIPDFSFDADPNTGVSVYDSTRCQGISGWLVFGGTSVSSPALAGIVNSAGHFYPDSATELRTMYQSISYPTNFYDVLTGTAGGNTAKAGYDFVTGIGSSRGFVGK